MNKLYKQLIMICVLCISCASFTFVSAAASAGEGLFNYSPKQLRILFTHDLHDHLTATNSGEGGYARLKTQIDIARGKGGNNILVDAGDYSMGTLFQTIFATDAPELAIMGEMGYDVTTFGNHEFDFTINGLTSHLYAAKNNSKRCPKIVSSNIIFPQESSMNASQYKLQQAMKVYGVLDYAIITKGDIKVGVFGLMGQDASNSTATSQVTFDDTVSVAKKMVKILKNQEKADIIICLSHSGTWTQKSKSEDEILAKKVPDIDVIISGHTHTKLDKPIIIGDTIIGSCGEYGEYLGEMLLTENKNGRWNLGEYALNKIDSSIAENNEVVNQISQYKELIQHKYLDNFGEGFDRTLAFSPFTFNSTKSILKEHKEQPLANLITDSFIYAVKKAEGEDYIPITAAIISAGSLRDSLVDGDVTISNVFSLTPLGIGADGLSSCPLVSAYISGKELKSLAELDASISPMFDSMQLFLSGISYTFNVNRLIFNKVTNVNIVNEDDSNEMIKDDKLYRVVTGMYNAQMLRRVSKKTYNMISVVPKTMEGIPIKDLKDYIIYAKEGSRKVEIKEWLAIAQYLASFDNSTGMSLIPAHYNTYRGSKNVDNNKSLKSLFEKPNKFAKRVYFLLIILVVLIIFLVDTVVKFIRTRKKSGR